MPDDQSQYPDNTDTVNTFIPPPSLMKAGPSCYQRMPDDPTPFIQNEAVVPEVGTGEERLQIVDLILLGLGQQV